MAEIKDVIAYFLAHYPGSMKHEMSNARLTKMVYLADWHSCLNNKEQITNIRWYFDNFGPFVRDVEVAAQKSPNLFSIDVVSNMYGQSKKLFSLKKEYTPNLTKRELSSLDHIISVTQKLYWADFIKLVYATHPIASSERYEFLNLNKKAADYQRLKVAKTQ